MGLICGVAVECLPSGGQSRKVQQICLQGKRNITTKLSNTNLFNIFALLTNIYIFIFFIRENWLLWNQNHIKVCSSEKVYKNNLIFKKY